jgi:hypothetical protein
MRGHRVLNEKLMSRGRRRSQALSSVNVSHATKFVSQVCWCQPMQTPKNQHTKLEVDPLRKAQPV